MQFDPNSPVQGSHVTGYAALQPKVKKAIKSTVMLKSMMLALKI